MKTRLVKFLGYVGLVYIIFAVGYLLFENDRLNKVIDRQNSLLKATTGKDIDFITKAQAYKDSINKITNKLAFIMNGDSLTASKFVKAYEKIETEKDSLNNKYKDLLSMYQFAEETYGFKIKTAKGERGLSLSLVPYTKADSATVALDVFRKRLKVTKNGWVVDVTGADSTPKFKIDMGDSNKKKKTLIDSIN